MTVEFVQLTPCLYVRHSTAYATNSGIVISDGAACLIDPAVAPDEIEAIAAFVRQQGATVRMIVLTHSHWDHILGPVHFPTVPIIAQRRFASTARREERGIRAGLADWERQTGVERHAPFVVPQPDIVFDESYVLTNGTLRLDLFHAPGHHDDLLVIAHQPSCLLWATDMLSDIEIPYVEHELAAYRRTLAWVGERRIDLLVPGHGAWTSDQQEIAARLAFDQDYLATLETMVTACLADGLSVEQTVERCASILIHHPDINAQPHRNNVETAWLECGGAGDPTTLGWGKEYERWSGER